MSEEKVNAKAEELVGGAKNLVGKVTGNKEVEAEGKVEQLAGKAKSAIADAKDAVKGAVEGLKK
ncbi:TPA: CsbD family protein [Streptococcus suis]|nr:CsbD family protein [Streptococcus suis]